jgi:SAM-dependent methyltransferase
MIGAGEPGRPPGAAGGPAQRPDAAPGTDAVRGASRSAPDPALSLNRRGWDAVAPRFCGGTALPTYGPLIAGEDELRLLPDVRGARVLELGCGSGHSLAYLAGRGAGELWGIDLSPAQLALAAATLRAAGHTARLIEAPMEADPGPLGIPAAHFDLVLSVYALGWTTDLRATLASVARALRPGGVFLFSWEHPVYGCLDVAAGEVVLRRPYGDEGPLEVDSWHGVPVVQQRRTLATYLNALTDAGLRLDRLEEPPPAPARVRPQDRDPEKWYSLHRARLMPTTLIVRAHRP